MPSFTVSTTRVIDARIDDVWAVLVDTERWHEWCSVLHFESGKIKVGERPTFRLTPPKGRSYSFRPTITALSPPERLSWVGRTGLTGIFDGAHEFVLTAPSPHSTMVSNTETFSGLLAPVMRRTLVNADEVAEGFDLLNTELADRAEQP